MRQGFEKCTALGLNLINGCLTFNQRCGLALGTSLVDVGWQVRLR